MSNKKTLRDKVTEAFTYICPYSIMKPNESYAANASVILALMKKTHELLELYNITCSDFSNERISECITELTEHITIGDIATHTYIYSAYSFYGEGDINYYKNAPEYIALWKKLCASESDSAALLMWFIMKHRIDIGHYERYDCHTAEHVLAPYNALWLHITYYPAISDEAFHLLVKNVCLIVHMNCIDFLNSYPQHIDEIKTNIY